MTTLVYDGSFAGLLTAVFDAYEYKYADACIMPENRQQGNMFGDTHTVHTDEDKAMRVWKGLKQKASQAAVTQVYKTFLSEQPDMEDMILRYMRHIFASVPGAEQDHSHPAVHYVTLTAKKVHREKHRMEAFVRFAQSNDGLYFATVEPDFNVLPLIADHFEKRYADQCWLIYDLKRKYGIYYDLHTVTFVQTENDQAQSRAGDLRTISLTGGEPHYQLLWQKYFAAVNITARKNMKLHLRHMPYRYWKYLTEKKPSGI